MDRRRHELFQESEVSSIANSAVAKGKGAGRAGEPKIEPLSNDPADGSGGSRTTGFAIFDRSRSPNSGSTPEAPLWRGVWDKSQCSSYYGLRYQSSPTTTDLRRKHAQSESYVYEECI